MGWQPFSIGRVRFDCPCFFAWQNWFPTVVGLGRQNSIFGSIHLPNIYIYIYIYMTPVETTLTYNLKQHLFNRLRNPKTNTLMQIAHFPFCRVPEASRREPEAYRKVPGRTTCSFLFYRSSGSSRKVPGRLTGSLLGAVVYMGPGRSRKVSGRVSGREKFVWDLK